MKNKSSKSVVNVGFPETVSEKIPQYNITTCKHMANLGDVVSCLGAVKKFYDVTKRKIMFCQVVNSPAQYYPGAVHPTVDESGQNVCINRRGFEMIKPLIESQEYIHSFVEYTGQKIDINFDVIRGQTDVNMPHGIIASWVTYAFPDLAFDLSKPWLDIPTNYPKHILKQAKGKIIVNFTERYRGHAPLEYFFLKNYAPDLIFSGTDKEHLLFCNRWNLNIPNLQVNNFLELAQALKISRFFLGNQSFQWNICEAAKIPRILEVCKWADNCQPGIGEDSYGYFYQVGVEYYFRMMYNKTANK